MYGKMLNTIINIMFITYLLLLVSFYFLHEGIKENVNNINYSTVDTIATSGVFDVEVYNNLKEKILNYSGKDCYYEMTIKYEKKVSSGTYDTYFIKDVISPGHIHYPTDTTLRNQVDPSHIITDKASEQIYPMYKGDKITIYLEDQNQTLYGKLITMPFMGMLGDYTDFRIKSLKSTMIGRDAKKLYSGYEVIEEINTPNRPYRILVRTEVSAIIDGSGTLYEYKGDNAATTVDDTEKYSEETDANKKIEVPAGSSVAEVGKYHIFKTGKYYRVWEDNNINSSLDANDVVTFYQTVD